MERTFKRVLSLLVAVVMVISMFPANVFATEPAATGSATQTDLTISTADELKAFADEVNGGNSFEGKKVVLANDIDLEYTAVVIGTKANPFKGTFDGQNYTVKNLSIYEDGSESDYFADTDDCVGLFGVINTPAVIKNVTVDNPFIVGSAYVGGIVGMAYTGKIENCHVIGEIDIRGFYMVGGITGHGYAKIYNCSVIGAEGWDNNYIGATYKESDLEGDNVGGIVGHAAEDNNIEGCTVKNVTVSGTRKVGGIVGITAQSTDLVKCAVSNVIVETTASADYAAGKQTTMSIGGIVGQYMEVKDGVGGKLSGCSVNGLTFTNENGVPVNAGALTGGVRASSGTTTEPAAKNIANISNTVANVTGATVDYMEIPNATVSVQKPIMLSQVEHGYKCWPNGDISIDRPLQIVMNFKANETLEQAKAGKYGKYICDFYLKLEGLENGRIETDGCYLAGNYGSFGWIVIPAEDLVLEEGISYPIVSAYDANLTYEDICGSVKDFTAAIYISKEILAANPKFQVTLELRMTNPENSDEILVIGTPYTYTAAELNASNQYFADYADVKTEQQENIGKVNTNTTIDEEANAVAIETAKQALKNQNSALSDAEISAAVPKVMVTFITMDFEATAPKKVVYDVSPIIQVGSNKVKIESFNAPVTFRLPISSAETFEKAKVYHEDELMGVYSVQVEDGVKFIEVSSKNFSTFTVEPTDGKVAEVGGVKYETLQAAINAAQAGQTVTLLSDVAVDNGSAYGIMIQKAITIDGNGHKITQAEGKTNEWALLYFQDTNGGVTIKNLTFDAITGGAAIWALRADVTVENCVFQNGAYTQKQGMVRMTAGDATVKNSKFLNNACNMVITFNFDIDASEPSEGVLTVENCVFDNNTCADTAIIYYVTGNGSDIKNNTFTNNTVDTASHGAVVYYSAGENCTVTGNTFSGNTIKAGSARACVLALEAGVKVNGNIFSGNTQSSTATGTTYVGTVLNKADADSEGVDVSGNYWDGKQPDVVNSKNAPTTLTNYYTTYANGTLGGEVSSVVYVAQIGSVKYETLQAAINAAQAEDTITILAGTISEGAIKLPAVLKNVTFKGEAGATLKDMTIMAADGNSIEYVDLTFDGITFDNSIITITGWRNGTEIVKNLTITNCVFKNIVRTGNMAAVHLNADPADEIDGFTFTSNVIDGVSGSSNSGIYCTGMGGNILVANNTINNVAFRPFVLTIQNNDGNADNVTITGNTFSGSAVGRLQVLGTDSAGTDAVNIVTTNNIFKDITDAQQICYWNFNSETTTADLSKNYYDIDIVANPDKIYFNSAAQDVEDLIEKGVYPYYTELNTDGTIKVESKVDAPVYVAEVNGVKYTDIQAAINAAQNGDTVVISAGEYGAIDISNKNITIKGTVGENGELLTTIKGGDPAITGHGFNGTIADLKIVDAWKVMYAEPAGNVTVDNVYVTGATYGFHLVAYSEGNTWTIQNSYMDLHWANSFGVYSNGDAEIIIKGNRFEATDPYYPEYGALAVNTFLPNVTVEENIFGEGAKIYVDASVTDTSNIKISKNYHADGVANAFADDSDGVKVDISSFYNRVDEEGNLSDLVYCVVQIGNTYYATLTEAIAAAQAGDVITLLKDIVLADTLTIEKSITINGNGHKILPADSDKTYNSAIMAGNSGWGDNHGETIKLIDLNLSGWKTNYGVIRAQGVTLEMTNCQLDNNAVANVSYAVVSLNYTYATITGCKFENNNERVIDINYNGDSSQAHVVIDDCTFTGNKSTGAGIVMRSAGTILLKNSTFTNNTVATNGNGATVYVGFGAGNEVTGCTFAGNAVTTSHATTKRFASAIFCDGCTVNGNVFGTNTAVRNGEAISTIVAVGAYYGDADISGNFWGGNAPVPGVDYTVEYSKTVAVDSYYADATLNQLVALNGVAKVGKYIYATLQAAINAAQNGATVTLLADIELADTVTIPAGKTITLELNGKIISQTKAQTAGYQMILNDGNLTIQDSVGGGKISYTDTVGGNFVSNTITNRGTLTLQSGRVENMSSAAVADAGFPYAIDTSIWGAATEVNTIIKGGVVYCESYSALRLRADSETESVNITITGGEIYGRIEVQNPTSNKASAGKLTVTGGIVNKNNSSMAVMVFGGGGTAENMKVEITGGNFAGAIGYSTYFPIDNFHENVITGGTFDTDVSRFVADGYKLTQNTVGTYTAGLKPVRVEKPSVGDVTVGGTNNTTEEQKEAIDGIINDITSNGAVEKVEKLESNEKAETDLQEELEQTMEEAEAEKAVAQAKPVLSVVLKDVALNTSNNPTKLTFDVKPLLVYGNVSVEIEPTEAITFRLPVPSSMAQNGFVKVYHEGELLGTYSVKTEDGVYYVEVKSANFSLFAIEEAKPVAEINGNKYASLQAAIDAAQAGQTVTLLADVALTKTLHIPAGKTLVLDGNGHKITPAAGFAADGHNAALAVAANDAAYNASNNYTIKNLTFEGFSGLTRVVRANFCDATIENCTFNGNTVSEGVITSAYAKLSVKDCAFNNNISNFATINVGSDVSTATDLAAKITGSSFAGNKADIAVIYLASSAEVIGNEFNSNEHTGTNANGAAILAGPYEDAGDYTITITGNAFVNAMGDKPAVFAEDWSAEYGANTAFDLSSNYWDGVKPEEGVAYKTSGANPNLKLLNYYTRIDENGTLSQLVKAGLQGSGTATDPYQIGSVEDLILFRDSVNAGETKYNAPGMYFVLTADIDLAGENWIGIGSATAAHGFMGNFDGKGYKIKNLTITDPAVDSDGYAYAGLFGVTEGTDKDNQNFIKNLIIENVKISTNGHIVAAAIAYPYYTIVEKVTVCGDIAITGGDYTAGVLAYTRRCVNASNLTIKGNEGSYIIGKRTVGGVIADIQMNGGLTAVYSNFNAEGVTITGKMHVGGIAGIISSQSITDVSVKNVTLSCEDGRVGIVAGSLGSASTVSNATYENVTGATAIVGAEYSASAAVQAKIGNTFYATLQAAVDAANAGDIIDLLAPIVVEVGETLTLDKDITITYTSNVPGEDMITNRGTLNISAGKIIYANTDATGSNVTVSTISCEPGSVLNVIGGSIENMTVKADGSAIYSYAIDMLTNGSLGDVTVTISGGTVCSNYVAIRQFNNGDICKNTLTIEGGYIYGAKRAVQIHFKNNAAYLDISGGEIKADGDYALCFLTTSENISVSGGKISGNVWYSGTTGFITGGTFQNPVAEKFCAEGYIPAENGDGTYGVKVGKFAAQIGDVKYETLQEAVNAAQAGAVIELLANGGTAVVSKELTIKQNDFTATVSATAGLTVVVENSAYVIKKAASVITGEAAIGGKIYETLADAIEAAQDGSFINLLANIAQKPENVTINKNLVIIPNGYTLWEADATVALGQITDVANFSVTQNFGIIFISKLETGKTNVAQINGVYYTSIKAALEAAKPGDVITMIADSYEPNSDLIINEGITLYLGAFDLTVRSISATNGAYVYGDAYHKTNDYATLKADMLILGETAPQTEANGVKYNKVPIYAPDLNCYVFSKYNILTNYDETGLFIDESEENKEIYFQFAQQLTGAVRTELLDKKYSAENNKFKVVVQLEWSGTTGKYVQNYVYNDEFVQAASKNTTTHYTFTLKGYDKLGLTEENMHTLRVRALIQSDSGVISSTEYFDMYDDKKQ